MQEQNSSEIWQVDVNGTLYEAPFSELGEWVNGGSLLPDDKVRKGNLRWIEARKVPALIPFFNAKANGQPVPPIVSTTIAEATQTEDHTALPLNAVLEIASDPIEGRSSLSASPVPEPHICALHRDLPSFYLCEDCGSGLCKACPNSYGGTVRLCPVCGAMCRPVTDVHAARQHENKQVAAKAVGFGITDFFSALGHPFKFKPSLFFGAFLFMVFTIGKGAGGLGGIFMFVAAVFSAMAANALTFGVLSHTINNFIQGRLEDNFMPEFEDFSLWDDVVHPFFLSIAAYVSSFAPFILVLLIGFYLVTSAVSNNLDSYKSDLERIPGTNVYAGRKLAEQSGDVKEVLNGIDERQRERLDGVLQNVEDSENGEAAPAIDEETRRQEEIWAMATESRKRSLESAIGRSAETEAREQAQMYQAFLGLAAPIVVVGGLAFLWGLFLFPASCAVAGYSRSFLATINPLVGLDTIKRLGFDYVKILAMGLVLGILTLFASGILAAVFTAFDLPGIGNLPATALSAFVTFYVSVVFSCVLGYALYKSADKLGLSR